MRNAKDECRKALESVVTMTVEPGKQTMALTMISAIVDRYVISDDEVTGPEHNTDLIEKYIQYCTLTGKSDGTIRMYRYALKGFVEHLEGTDIRRTTSKDIMDYLGKLKAREVSNSYISTRRAWLSSFFTWMENTDEIVKSPMRAVSPVKKRKEVRRPFTEVELDKLRSSCSTARQRAVIEVLLATGMRVNELVNVKVEDIDWVTKAIHAKECKGGKERIVYMNDLAMTYLRSYMGIRNEGWMAQTKDGRQIDTDTIRKMLKGVAEKSGVTDVHPHRFRRTFATTMVNRGMPLNELQILMGHSKIDTTMTYVYQTDRQIEASYRKHVA